MEQGFAIERETMLKEEGKYYVVMDVVRGQMESLKPWESLVRAIVVKGKESGFSETFAEMRRPCVRVF